MTLTLVAQTAERTARMEEAEIRANPRYSRAILQGKSAEEFLAQAESALDESGSLNNAYGRFLTLPRAAKYALEAGQNDKAKRYADEALDYLKSHPQIPPSGAGQAVVDCNLVLGRLALLDGDVPQAEDYLLLAGTTRGSPPLDTFGPNMSLARELLKRTRSQAVLKFFDECNSFWLSADQRGLLDGWSADVQAGRMPVFRANLYY